MPSDGIIAAAAPIHQVGQRMERSASGFVVPAGILHIKIKQVCFLGEDWLDSSVESRRGRSSGATNGVQNQYYVAVKVIKWCRKDSFGLTQPSREKCA